MARPHDRLDADPAEPEADVPTPDAPPRRALSRAEADTLVLLWSSMQGLGPDERRSRIDLKFAIPVVLGLLSTAGLQLKSYTQLGDQVGDLARRQEIVERIQIDRGKELVVQANENVLQDERLQTITKALEQERQARQDAETDMRRSAGEQRAIVNDLSRIIGEMRADFKVIVERLQRHGELDRVPDERG